MQVQCLVVRLPSVVSHSVVQVTGTLSSNYEDHLNVSFKERILNWPQIFCEFTIDLWGKELQFVRRLTESFTVQGKYRVL
jgi:hypothetical protein